MLFWTDKAEKNGPKIEAKLRKELGVAAPLAFEVEIEGSYKPGSVGQALGDVATALFGGRCRPLYTFRFQVQQPRAAEIRVSVIKEGNAVVLGALLYSTVLAKAVTAPVSLEPEKVFSKSRFTGDATLAGKLNANQQLIARINKFVRTSYSVGNATVRAERFLKIDPFGGGALLAINTLPRSTWLGLGASFDARAFFDIAGLVEASL